MARIRSVKPEFWDDQELAEQVSRDARLLYIGLWNLADEHGRLRGDARFVRGRVFPYDDDLSVDAVTMFLAELALVGKVIPYQTEAGIYLFLPNLARHQRLETEKVASKLPDPSGPDSKTLSPRALIDACRSESRADLSARRAEKMSLLYGAWSMEHVTADAAGAASHTDADRGDPDFSDAESASADDQYGETTEGDPSGNADEVDEEEPRLPSTHPNLSWTEAQIDADPLWIDFWKIYPKSADKPPARKAWLRALRDKKADPADLVDGAAKYRNDPRRKPDYTKNAATWLNAESWKNYDQETAQPPEEPRNLEEFWNN
ncbi:hypothetical protein ACIA5D_17730 [Actinoplanes sp. NPDC051513]|uniref:hypothetical protein n=1 Tax=Actinoplanes sp. NPDC051513 TaxID=3363908 RepID=UPI0037BBD9C2